eukprot:TRINITY_DN27059_c0_g1_i1.p1 TRINITY_DN27059_c0_g1~~TRINITY_DN27059_c0_g1_i1.p1  ORF type:complete len:359 (+),score=32.46 TRINITY_DN27059_c0_g1_i1:67-1143(+)
MRMLCSSVCVVLVSCLALLVSQNWGTLVFIRRLAAGADPEGTVKDLSALLGVLPRDQNLNVVIVAIPAKSGTTWMGHIVHQLLTRGSDDIDFTRNLMADSPYPELAEPLLGSKLHLLDPPYWTRSPFPEAGTVTVRTHATHAQLRGMNATELDGYKLLTVLRDPRDTLLSSWRFLTEMVDMETSQVPISNLARLLRMAGELHGLYAHYVDMWQRRHHPSVLLLFYDDLKEDLGGSIRRVANHLVSDPARANDVYPDEIIERVAQQSTHAWMSDAKRSPRFDVPREARLDLLSKIGLSNASKQNVETVRKKGGRSGEGKVLPEAVKTMLQEVWDEVVLPATNCTSLDEMRLKFRAERAR